MAQTTTTADVISALSGRASRVPAVPKAQRQDLKLIKLAKVLRRPGYWPGLRHGVAAAIEHDRIPFDNEFRTVIDVGAGRGQFALVARRRFPAATLHCFAPLSS